MCNSGSSVHVGLHICWNFRSLLYSLVGTKVQGSELPGRESSKERKFQGTKVPGSEWSWEREVHNSWSQKRKQTTWRDVLIRRLELLLRQLDGHHTTAGPVTSTSQTSKRETNELEHRLSMPPPGQTGSWRHYVLSVLSSVTKLVNRIFWKRINQFWCKLVKVVYRARAWNSQLVR